MLRQEFLKGMFCQMFNVPLFRIINESLKNPFFDAILPVFSDKNYIVIPGAVLVGTLIFFGGKRTRLGLLALIPALLLSDIGSEKVFKNVFREARPYAAIADVHVHRGGQWITYEPGWYEYDGRKSFSFPSTHAANVAAVAAVLAFLSLRTLWGTIPLVFLVGFSRIYTGNHYPGDVLGGYALGTIAGCVSAGLILRLNKDNVLRGPRHESWAAIHPARRTFYILLASWTLFNFAFVHLNRFDLAGDEAQYWDWSRHLALGYYSKPPLIAYVMAIFVSAGGHEEWAIRSGAVICSSVTVALIYGLTLRIAKQERTALLAALITMAMPAMWAGSVLMTIDPLLCLSWAAALYAFHRAVNGEPRYWWVTGVALGFGLLAKYTMVLLPLAFVLYLTFVDRTHWRKPGPYVALVLTLACTAGVLYWNWTHDWISFRHTASIGASGTFRPATALEHVAQFFGGQLGVASPILLGFMVWAVGKCIAHFKRDRDAALLSLAFLSIFGAYLFISITHAPEPNWPVCAYIAGAPALAWMWRERDRRRGIRRTLVAGLALGAVMGLATRSTDLLYVMADQTVNAEGQPSRIHVGPVTIDPDMDPTNALRGGRELGAALSRHIGAGTDNDPFPFSDRYQLTAWSAFYTKGRPRAYCMNVGDRRLNQYDLWDGWDELTGRDGLFVTGGGQLKALAFVTYMVANGFFASGEIVETVNVQREGIIVKRLYVARMQGYTGKDWPTEQGKF